ncbi:hypothetical protein EDC44_10672 [Cricetibacter osteomyelitidis]|uniref:Uncharacterized protein n=1 Tax=Cricetibacter osteomyelitidis TaxID=1521931 RepID=A0A4V2T244_9PAST|nr:hypothetical protein [Cricetibacter osteomyelitidis]TCP96013.1 hypothetical protein EDC44_10672 [Cricetibacter osteomyelitidis]
MTELEYYITEKMIENIVETIAEQQHIEPLAALGKFYQSETYAMLKRDELKLWQLSDKGLFDLWQNEIQHGNPRLSRYL